MNIPGMTVSHQIIRQGCRDTHGVEAAFHIAVLRLRDAYYELAKGGIDDQTEIHLALIVQQDRHRQVGKCGPLPGGEVDLSKPPPGPPNPPRPDKWNEVA